MFIWTYYVSSIFQIQQLKYLLELPKCHNIPLKNGTSLAYSIIRSNHVTNATWNGWTSTSDRPILGEWEWVLVVTSPELFTTRYIRHTFWRMTDMQPSIVIVGNSKSHWGACNARLHAINFWYRYHLPNLQWGRVSSWMGDCGWH